MFDIKDYVDQGFMLEAAKEFPVRLCGFIVYSRKNPHVAKLLRDFDYWRELDAISGVKWPIFAIRPVAKTTPYTRKDAQQEEADEMEVRACLDISGSDIPCFVCFIWNDNGELQKITHRIDDRTLETTHADLREIVSRVSDVINDILPEYMQSENVFRNVRFAIEAYNTQTKVRDVAKNAKWTIDMLNSLPLTVVGV
jgi:hypothetical protein